MTAQATEGRLGRRLSRILLLLPYAIKHPGVTLDELSRKFAVKKQDLVRDLDLVFLCGLPGYGPGDLIEVSVDEERVFVRMADYFAAPVRLTPSEALALYAGAQPLTELPGMEDADALKRALAKLARALGMDPETEPGVDVLVDAAGSEHLETLQRALTEQKRVRLEYMSASSGELRERSVDPWGIVAARGRWYLIAWDHRSEDERMFRIDRVKASEILDEAAEVPDDFDPERYRGAFAGGSDEPTMWLEISPEVARWFEDYYPVSSSEELDEGWRRIALVASGERWAATLILRLGEGVRNVEPPELAAAARELAQQIAARYA